MVFQFLMQIMKLLNYIEKAENVIKNLKKYFLIILLPSPLKKNELSKAIIDERENLKKIVKVVHPEVRNKMNNFIKKNKNKKFIVLDIPLLIENKLNKKNEILIFVDAKKKEINKRLKQRTNFSV